MAYEERDGFGTLFKIPEDKVRDRGPTMSGSLTIDGKRYRVAAWKKQSGNRPPFLSLSLKPWEDRDERTSRRNAEPEPF